MKCFSLKITVKYCGLREDEQRLEKLVKYVFFVKAEPRLEKLVKDVPFEHQKTPFGGPLRAFSWKNRRFYSSSITKNPILRCFGGEKRPQSDFWYPKGTYFTDFSNLSLPSAENREEPRILR